MQLLPLCATPKVALKDGNAGINASIQLPFYSKSRWFANGMEYDFPNTEFPQNTALNFLGTSKPGVFQKDCCTCFNPA